MKTFVGQVHFLSTCPGATELKKYFSGLHAYTGCDTGSGFAGKCKAHALNILTSNKESQDSFNMLEQEWDLSQYLLDKPEPFTCGIYAQISSCGYERSEILSVLYRER